MPLLPVTAQYAPAGTQPAGAPAQYPPPLKEPTMTDQPETTAPPAADLRDRIRRAICEASGFTWLPDELMEPDEYGEHADAVLAVLPAPTDHVAADELADRRARYAAAIRDAACLGDCGDPEDECVRRRVQPGLWQGGVLVEVMGTPEVLAEAVMPGANAEQQELRAQIANLRTMYNAADARTSDLIDERDALRAEVERLRADPTTMLREAADHDRQMWADLLRRLADEVQQPTDGVTLCGKTTAEGGATYPPCARHAGHNTAYCRDASGSSYFLAAAPAPTEEPQSPTALLLAATCTACPHPLGSHQHYRQCLADGCTCTRYTAPTEEPTR